MTQPPSPSHPTTHSIVLRAASFLCILATVAATARVSAQEVAELPPCGAPPTADEPPCRSRYDAPPVLDPVPAPPPASREMRKPRVWMLVDETGAVRHAHVDVPAGVDWDLAALDRARQLHFRPATLAGSPVAAWVLMEVEAVPPPATCAGSMRVPLSAGAFLVDSARFADPSFGTQYTYRADGVSIDVFIYPRKDGQTARGEVEGPLTVISRGLVRGEAVEAVVRAGTERVRPRGRFRDRFAGYAARFRGSLGGVPSESYIAVFPGADGQWLKIRSTWPRGVDAMPLIRGFLDQFLGAEAHRIHGCPR